MTRHFVAAQIDRKSLAIGFDLVEVDLVGIEIRAQLALAGLGVAREGLRGLPALLAVSPSATTLSAVELLLEFRPSAWSRMTTRCRSAP
jgi:hypothetical protein